LSRLKAWFRQAVDVRDADGAERSLRTAIASGAEPRALADLLLAAATDHYYLDAGHVLDFINKACELLDLLGWDEVPGILPSLVDGLCRAQRSEEQKAWRTPLDLTGLLEPAFAELPGLIGETVADAHDGAALSADRFDALVRAILADEPRQSVAALLAALRQQVSLAELGQAVAHAASLRIARFPTSNEFGDWDSVHNTFSSCNALHQAILRAPSAELARGLFHAAMRIYLDRFLNVPPARLPDEQASANGAASAAANGAASAAANGAADPPADPSDLLDLLDREQQVQQAARLVDAHLAAGRDARGLIEILGRAVLREDADFHDYQELEGAWRQFTALQADRPLAARRALVAMIRYEAAHCPTSRALRQTYQIALRLQRGDALYQEEA
jgi:hypothetical protein